MPSIGVVGAGVAASAAAFVIDRDLSDADCIILEKSRGVGGRAATRRRGDVTYDYGANYVTSRDERVADLLTETLDRNGLVDVVEPVYTCDRSGSVSPGEETEDHRWAYRRCLT